MTNQNTLRMTTSQVRRGPYLTCMKNSTTSAALNTAIPKATTVLKAPRSTLAARTVRSVPSIKMPKTVKYTRVGTTWSMDMGAYQIKQWKQENPDNVDEMPVEPDDFDRASVVGCRCVAPRSREHYQHCEASRC